MRAIKKFKAILLAGGVSKLALQKMTGQKYKALMMIDPIHPGPMIYHMIEVLHHTKYISKLYITGPNELHEVIGDQHGIFIPSGLTLMETLTRNVLQLKEEPYILISTCDIPLVLNKHIEHFIEGCLNNPGFDIYYAIIEKEAYSQVFPSNDLRRVYANLVEGSFTGGNLFFVNPKVIIDCGSIIQQFILFRKHPLKMAKILGRRIVIKYLKKYLSIRDLEKLVPQILKGYQGKAILADPEIALDIDKPIQLNALKSLIKT